MSGRTIPEIRERMRELVGQMHEIADELDDLAEETKREYHGRRAPNTHRSPDASQQAAIREYAITHPDVDMHTIGTIFGVNQGRVSEALFGKRQERE